MLTPPVCRACHRILATAAALLFLVACSAEGPRDDQIPNPNGRTSLLLAIHGGGFDETPATWAEDFIGRVRRATPTADAWRFHAYDWSHRSRLPPTAPFEGADEGRAIGERLAESDYTHLHLVGHSVGAVVLESALEQLPPPGERDITVHATFLDPFATSEADYGANADFAVAWYDTRDTVPDGEVPMATAYNIDVTALGRAEDDRSHWFPIEAWLDTVETLGAPGFGLSAMAGGFSVELHDTYPRGDEEIAASAPATDDAP